MTAYQLFTVIGFAIIVPLYVVYLFLKRKDESDKPTTEKIILALKELGKRQPEFGEYLHKIGLL